MKRIISILTSASVGLFSLLQVNPSLLISEASETNGFSLSEIESSEIKPELYIGVDGSKHGKVFDVADAAGKTVECSINVSGADWKYASTGLHIYYDSRLEMEVNGTYNRIDVNAGKAILGLSPGNPKQGLDSSDGTMKSFFVCTVGGDNDGRDGEMWNFRFKVPSTAQAGDVFPIDIKYESNPNAGDLFVNTECDSKGKLMQAFAFTKGIFNPSYNNTFSASPEDLEKCPALADINRGFDGYIAISSAPATKYAATSGEFGKGLSYTIDDSGTLTISGNGAMPTDQSGYGVPQDPGATGISTPWYDYAHKIESVVIENGVTTIGYGAFNNLSELTSVSIPDSVKTIGEQAFYGCRNLSTITIPDSVTEIGIGAIPEKTKIEGSRGSAAEAYANENGNDFIALAPPQPVIKDTYYLTLTASESRAFEPIDSSVIDDVKVSDESVAMVSIAINKRQMTIQALAPGNCSILVYLSNGDVYQYEVSVSSFFPVTIPYPTTSTTAATTSATATTTTTTTTAVAASTTATTMTTATTIDLGETINLLYSNVSTEDDDKVLIRNMDIPAIGTINQIQGIDTGTSVINTPDGPFTVEVRKPEIKLYVDDTEVKDNVSVEYYKGMQLRAEISNVFVSSESGRDVSFINAVFLKDNEKNSTAPWDAICEGQGIISGNSVTFVLDGGDLKSVKNDFTGRICLFYNGGNVRKEYVIDYPRLSFEQNSGMYMLNISASEDTSTYDLGDPNNDGMINSNDASLILVEYSKLSTGRVSVMSASQSVSADVNSDGAVDSKDASIVLSYYAYLSTTSGQVVTMSEFVSGAK